MGINTPQPSVTVRGLVRRPPTLRHVDASESTGKAALGISSWEPAAARVCQCLRVLTEAEARHVRCQCRSEVAWPAPAVRAPAAHNAVGLGASWPRHHDATESCHAQRACLRPN